MAANDLKYGDRRGEWVVAGTTLPKGRVYALCSKGHFELLWGQELEEVHCKACVAEAMIASTESSKPVNFFTELDPLHKQCTELVSFFQECMNAANECDTLCRWSDVPDSVRQVALVNLRLKLYHALREFQESKLAVYPLKPKPRVTPGFVSCVTVISPKDIGELLQGSIEPTPDRVIEMIGEVLAEGSGEWVQKIANKVLTEKVQYNSQTDMFTVVGNHE